MTLDKVTNTAAVASAVCALILSLVHVSVALAGDVLGRDPRLCSSHRQVDCARRAAVIALRRAIAVRDQLSYPLSQGLPPQCVATKRDWLNFRCTFWDHHVQEAALVWLGRAPLWKPNVRFVG